MSRETMKSLRLSILLVLGVGIVLGIMIAQMDLSGPKQPVGRSRVPRELHLTDIVIFLAPRS